MINFTIRAMQIEDVPLLAAWMIETPLWQRYGLSLNTAISNFETGMARDDWLLVAEVEGQVCGFAWVIPKGTFGRSPYLRLIGVQADKAGSGIGSGLMDAVERKSAEVTDDMFLLVSDFNEGAQNFYRQRGYIQVGAIEAYVVADVTELIFRKRLK